MNKTTNSDWNKFWVQDRVSKKARISCSKARIMNVLAEYRADSKTALDAGCGSGFFSSYFCEQGLETVALDYSAQALELTRALIGDRVQLLCSDLVNDELAGLTSQRFDLVFSDGLFEHFTPAEQDKIMNNLGLVLKEDGVVFTFVPNRWSPWQLIRPFFMPGIKETPFVMKELLNLHTRNGLRVIASGGLNTFPFRFSPDRILGRFFGMLLFVVARK